MAMKKKSLRTVFCVMLVSCVLLSSSAWPAMALTSDNQVIPVDWETAGSVAAVEQRDDTFVLSVKTDSGRVNNLYFSFPAEGGLRLHADQEGYFRPGSLQAIEYSTQGSAVVMRAGGTTVRLDYQATPWRVEIGADQKESALVYTADQIQFGYDKTGALRKVKVSAPIAADEAFFGLGERFSGFVLNGKSYEMWNYDSFTQLAKSYGDHTVGYKNIPLLHSSKGYSVFHNNTYYGIADVGETDAAVCSFEFYGPILDMYLWTGSAAENIQSYCRLTGSTIVPPKWALSYWAGQAGSIWKAAGDDNASVIANLEQILDKYDELGTPIKNLYAESISAMSTRTEVMRYLQKRGIRYFGWMDSSWRTFDDNIKAQDVGTFGSINPAEYPLVKFADSPLSAYWDKNGVNYVDYTNPLSVNWLTQRFQSYFKLGLSGMMVDYNDAMELTALYTGNGGTGDWMHNFSSYYYDKAVSEAFSSYYKDNEYILFARAASAGSQAYAASFAGDQSSSFLGLQQVVSALLSSAASGINIWGSDIGGLGSSEDVNKHNAELYARWLQFGTFSPLMRAHGQNSTRDPWDYDSNGASSALFQKYYWTRENLVDLIYSASLRANRENRPLTMAMAIAYPEQADMTKNESQYLFCDSLLVAPITQSGASSVTIQFPEGRWVGLWDGAVVSGGRQAVVGATVDTIPVYLEAGSAVPVTLGPDLQIGTSTTDGATVPALLTAPAVQEKVNTIFESETKSSDIVCGTLGESRYFLRAGDGSDRRVVVVRGCTASAVRVDDKELTALSSKPDSSTVTPGYYKDLQTNSTVIITDGGWNYMEYTDSQERLSNLALGCPVSVNTDSDKTLAAAANLTDGQYDTALPLSEDDDFSVTIDLVQPAAVRSIELKWAGNYAKGYVLEGTDQLGENGKDTVWATLSESKDGSGGTDIVTLDGSRKFRYLRLSRIDNGQKRDAQLMELEVYGDTVYLESEGQPTVTVPKEGTGDNGDSSGTVWVWFAIGAAGLLAIGGTVLAVLLVRRKKKTVKTETPSDKEP